MTKKDYIKVATGFKKIFDEGIRTTEHNEMFWNMVDTISEVFENDNPLFDKEKFVSFIDPIED